MWKIRCWSTEKEAREKGNIWMKKVKGTKIEYMYIEYGDSKGLIRFFYYIYLFSHLYIHLFFHSFIHSFIRSCIYSIFYSSRYFVISSVILPIFFVIYFCCCSFSFCLYFLFKFVKSLYSFIAALIPLDCTCVHQCIWKYLCLSQ